MKLLIVSCSPRQPDESNTNIVIHHFAEGCQKKGVAPVIKYLQKKGGWEEIKSAMEEVDHVIFATPLYVENIPGIFLEFLEGLEPLRQRGKMGFILIGGFPEACQYVACVKYLKSIPARYNCDLTGVLYQGNTFNLHFFEPGSMIRKEICSGFVEMGSHYCDNSGFSESLTEIFAGPYRFNAIQRFLLRAIMPIQNGYFKKASKALGCTESLRAKPYENKLKR